MLELEFLNAPVAQGIEHWFPKPCAHVQVMPGAPYSRKIIKLFCTLEFYWRMQDHISFQQQQTNL